MQKEDWFKTVKQIGAEQSEEVPALWVQQGSSSRDLIAGSRILNVKH